MPWILESEKSDIIAGYLGADAGKYIAAACIFDDAGVDLHAVMNTELQVRRCREIDKGKSTHYAQVCTGIGNGLNRHVMIIA